MNEVKYKWYKEVSNCVCFNENYDYFFFNMFNICIKIVL